MGHKNGYYGPMNPTKKRVYAFLEEFFEEISQVFPRNISTWAEMRST